MACALAEETEVIFDMCLVWLISSEGNTDLAKTRLDKICLPWQRHCFDEFKRSRSGGYVASSNMIEQECWEKLVKEYFKNDPFEASKNIEQQLAK